MRKNPYDYKAWINVKILGIPAIVGVTHFEHKEPDPECWSSDIDFKGYTECEFDILDRNGHKAPWLEDKLDESDIADLAEFITNKLLEPR